MTSRDVLASYRPWVLGHWYSVIGLPILTVSLTVASRADFQANHAPNDLATCRDHLAGHRKCPAALRLPGNARGCRVQPVRPPRLPRLRRRHLPERRHHLLE